MRVFERVVRPVLFRRDAEEAHEWTLRQLSRLPLPKRLYAVRNPVRVFGIDFPNPVGLAAGMDKNGIALRAWPALGFGFVEVGTVTWHAQAGNERPRMFRFPEREAIVNRMGFNNQGASMLAQRLAGFRSEIPLGISLGKSKVTPLDRAVEDYRASFEVLREHGDYFAVNVSSPNTPGLRSLQDKSFLDGILAALTGQGKPILVKIAPDLTDSAIGDVLAVCADRGVAGVIATNTTIAHDGPTGGLSGAPLTKRALEVVTFVRKESDVPIIGVGGIMTPDDAMRMFDAGASLIQLYTGFVYHGPDLVRRCARGFAGAG
ncbi:quinone-dependent dihydroorotate dehydrogenase [Allorhizocola rhizosphaerae]|uniref:quinone-dependent dihydroorotate dehydrogenase n=1 Tax=Allorhizocola rhizosphaerae TaxID=1872709 RepID=UPI000E3C3844|nr:quinone-dependent dihydroorotate dehydrogenase [Allorhizocola rhizosphaerae]